MSMTKQIEESFAMFYGMSTNLATLAVPEKMSDEERVENAKKVFRKKIDANAAVQLESCIKCGLCAEACHYYIGTQDPKYTPVRKLGLIKNFYKREYSPFRWFHRLYTPDMTADDLREYQPLVYDSCTECGRCSMICPMGIHIAELVAVNRQAMAEAALIPDELRVMQQGQWESGTIFEADKDILQHKVDEVSEHLGFKVPVDEKTANILVLTSGLDIMLFNDALQGTAKIMDHLGEPWSFCTEAYEGANFGLLSGHEDTQRAASTKIIETAVACGAKLIITPECGHAFPSLRWSGAEMVGHALPFDVMSISEYLGKKVMEGKLKLNKVAEKKVVALHDPCKVGRMGGSFEEGRAVVRELGLDLKETPSSHQQNICCGGGAGVFLIHRAADLRQAAYEVKMKDIKTTGAEALVVSCGSCRLNFEVGKMKAHDNISVDSLVGLVAEHLPEKASA